MNQRTVEWVVHPLESQKGRGIFALVVILLTAVAAYIFMESLYFSFFSIVLLILGCGKFFFPTRFILSEQGVTERYLGVNRFQEWEYFKRHYEKANGVFLSPFQKHSWLEKYRAWYIHPKSEKMLDFSKEKTNLDENLILPGDDA